MINSAIPKYFKCLSFKTFFYKKSNLEKNSPIDIHFSLNILLLINDLNK